MGLPLFRQRRWIPHRGNIELEYRNRTKHHQERRTDCAASSVPRKSQSAVAIEIGDPVARADFRSVVRLRGQVRQSRLFAANRA
jgi:hypothetical protein